MNQCCAPDSYLDNVAHSPLEKRLSTASTLATLSVVAASRLTLARSTSATARSTESVCAILSAAFALSLVISTSQSYVVIGECAARAPNGAFDMMMHAMGTHSAMPGMCHKMRGRTLCFAVCVVRRGNAWYGTLPHASRWRLGELGVANAVSSYRADDEEVPRCRMEARKVPGSEETRAAMMHYLRIVNSRRMPRAPWLRCIRSRSFDSSNWRHTPQRQYHSRPGLFHASSTRKCFSSLPVEHSSACRDRAAVSGHSATLSSWAWRGHPSVMIGACPPKLKPAEMEFA